MFVVGDEGLQDADSRGKIGLAQAALAAQAGQAPAEGLAAIVQRRKLEAGDAGRSPLRYHTLLLAWEFFRYTVSVL